MQVCLKIAAFVVVVVVSVFGVFLIPSEKVKMVGCTCLVAIACL